ncbi:MAG TPA: glycosyl hydrolase [Solirubrobacterales bacterium]|nr:glycosyl hydrolase [Solirubrobacterales bacterium]
MTRTRLAISLLLASLAVAAAAAPLAAAAEGIASAVALDRRGATDSRTTTAGNGTGAVAKQQLVVTTQSPADGQTVSGSIVWQVAVSGGTPSRVDFAVDGTVRSSQTVAPYAYGGTGGALDTTALANGSHTLTATAYGSRGVRASSTVSVDVANTVSQPEPESTSELEPLPTGGGGPIYWGATIGSQLTGNQAPWDMSAVTKFEELTRKPVSLVQFFQPFASCGNGSCSFYSFPTTPLENVRQHGSIPVLSWSSQSIPSSLNEPDFQLSDVIAGRYDSYIRSFASAAKAWGHPFFLRFDWEMNGTWFPWSEGVNGNNSGEFVTAWRHVHDVFSSVGASNVTWVWCPNVDWNNSLSKLASMYPGDAYVDWTGLDGYHWGTNPVRPGGWKSFDQVYRATYRHLVETVAPAKPLMIGEVASSEYGGSKASWVREMLTKVPAEYTRIRALLWFDKYDDGMDWPIETSSTASGAFAEAIQNPVYTGDAFSTLSATAVQPAS